MSIYIIFCLIVIIFLFLLVYKVYICILALSNSTAELSSLCPQVVFKFGLGQTKQEQKHWVTKCHFENFLKLFLFSIFAAIAIFFLFPFFFFSDVMSSSFQWMQNFQLEILKQSRKTLPTVPMEPREVGTRLSHGYLYINLPPVFMCLLPVVLSYL